MRSKNNNDPQKSSGEYNREFWKAGGPDAKKKLSEKKKGRSREDQEMLGGHYL